MITKGMLIKPLRFVGFLEIKLNVYFTLLLVRNKIAV